MQFIYPATTRVTWPLTVKLLMKYCWRKLLLTVGYPPSSVLVARVTGISFHMKHSEMQTGFLPDLKWRMWLSCRCLSQNSVFLVL